MAHAQAQAPSPGELFKQGRALVKQGKYAEACDKFRKSQELDPQLGTLFNIAQCDEKIGKLASALAAYREVVAKDSNAQRRALAAAYQSKLEPRVPKIVVQIAKPPPSLVVTLDTPTGGKPIDANLPIEVDMGDYSVIARADGYRELTTKVTVAKEGETTTVPLALALVHGHDTVTQEPQPHQPPPPEQPEIVHHSSRAMYGKLALGVGGAAVIGGAIFGVLANGAWSDAKAVCGGTTCPTQMQVDQANQHVADARSDGTLSTALFVGGVVVAGAGLALWLTAPSDEHAVHVTAMSTGAATSFVLAGRF
ncbi:MAG: tetratricopeptide repeat protein [Acidobacteriota bacterium]